MPATPAEIEINPETLLFLNRSRVVGGRTSHREIVIDELTGQRRDTEIKTEVVIDNVEERKEAENLVARTHGAVRKVTSVTTIGHLGPASKLEECLEAFAQIDAEARDFNARAQTCTVEVGLIPIKIAVALGPEAIRAITREAQGRLIEIRDALKAGDTARVVTALRLGKNLHTLAQGPVADGIAFGLDEARERFSELKKRCKADNGVSETPASVGRTLDLSMLESAIGMMSVADPGTAPATLAWVA